MSGTVYNCNVCGKPCAELDDADVEVLADGASRWYVSRIACERAEFCRRRQEAADREALTRAALDEQAAAEGKR